MRSHRVLVPALSLLLAAAVAVSVHAQTAAPQRTPDVQFVPTDEKIVTKMLEMAKVTKADHLIDLGSGDGRIVITAAKRYGARGMGVEIDPALVQKARENAQAAGVADRATFVEGDLFEANIRDATVITMYLLPDLNLRLRPKLLNDLKPGTRIVSHNYDLGDWKPAQTATVLVGGTQHTVYFWVVPPRAAGTK
jgi:protein-L-isoaspartate O-methyltransferase